MKDMQSHLRMIRTDNRWVEVKTRYATYDYTSNPIRASVENETLDRVYSMVLIEGSLSGVVEDVIGSTAKLYNGGVNDFSRTR